jgi:hypothetical protein
MGVLHYGARAKFTFDDRLLTHLRTVILSKFGLQESMAFSWNEDGHQHTIWLHPALAIHFEFEQEATPDLNPAWVEHMLQLASSPSGLRITDEPE